MSHRAAYHIWITKGKGSECFTASKTPVGHVMTQFRIVCNITPRLKAIILDHPNFCKVIGRTSNDRFKPFDRYLQTSWEGFVEFITGEDRIPIFSFWGSVGMLVIMFFTHSNFDHVGYFICFHVDEPYFSNIGE